MRVTIDGKLHKVRWMYDTAFPRIVTTCRIEEIDGDNKRNLVSEGNAWCSALDRFEKETGRKVSLTRAVQNLSRDERTVFWKAYFERNKSIKAGVH